MSWILNHEPAVRLGAFLGVFAVMALWELVGPRRRLTTAKGARWFANLGITIVDTVVVRLLFPAAAVGMAVCCGRTRLGSSQPGFCARRHSRSLLRFSSSTSRFISST